MTGRELSQKDIIELCNRIVHTDCENCGARCCGNVGISPSEHERLTKWYRDKYFYQNKKGDWRIHNKAGKCVFLDGWKCIIQIEHGFDAKPFLCKQFPLWLNPDGTWTFRHYESNHCKLRVPKEELKKLGYVGRKKPYDWGLERYQQIS